MAAMPPPAPGLLTAVTGWPSALDISSATTRAIVGATAKLLGQAAACLAQDVPADAPGGFWTTSSLLGDSLLKRLQEKAGMTFTVID